MISWNYDANNYNENFSGPIPPVGDHRVRIEEVTDLDKDGAPLKSKKSGNAMIKITLAVSGYSSKVFHYIVFMPENKQMTDQKLGEVYESFGIKPGNLNILEWRGRVGAARIKHEMYEGNPQPRVSYFLTKRKQEGLLPWVGSEPGEMAPVSSLRENMSVVEDEVNIPF